MCFEIDSPSFQFFHGVPTVIQRIIVFFHQPLSILGKNSRYTDGDEGTKLTVTSFIVLIYSQQFNFKLLLN